MKRTKKQWLGIGRFVDEVVAALESREIEVRIDTPFDRKAVDSNFSIHAVAMTDVGRLEIWVHDWIHTRFEMPAAAAKQVDCNPLSGKWNFHFDSTLFGAEKPGAGEQDYVAECVAHFAWNLDRVEARTWVTTPVVVSEEEVNAHSKTYWERRSAMGDDIGIDGFDSEAAKDWLADVWTHIDGSTTQPEWNRSWISRDGDVITHFHIKDFAGRNPEIEIPNFYNSEHGFAPQGVR